MNDINDVHVVRLRCWILISIHIHIHIQVEVDAEIEAEKTTNEIE